MLNRFPKQTRSRRAYAAIGLLFFAFSLIMAYVEVPFGAVLFGAFSLLFLVPPLVLNEHRFSRFERVASWLSTFGSLA